MAKPPPRVFPLGRRGERPVRFTGPGDPLRVAEARKIPGIEAVFDSQDQVIELRCTWEAAPGVARVLGVPVPVPPTETTLPKDQLLAWFKSLPGYDEYVSLGFPQRLRKVQKPAVLYLAWRAAAIEGDPPRTGKTPISLAAAIAIGARRVMVLAPDLIKWQWAEEVYNWTGYEAIVLEGRGGTEASVFCGKCRGKGVIEVLPGLDDEPGVYAPCSWCRGANGQSYGYRMITVADMGECGEHPADRTPRYIHEPCGACHDRLVTVLAGARFWCVNPDILIPHKVDIGGGAVGIRRDLQGWGQILKGRAPDLVIIDEIHRYRGHMYRGKSSKRAQTFEVCAPAEVVWGLTGTFWYGFIRDGFQPLQIISGGLWAPPGSRRINAYGDRYCERMPGEHGGYDCDGESELARTELKERVRYVMLERPESETLEGQPPYTRRVMYVDAPRNYSDAPTAEEAAAPEGANEHLQKRLEKAAELKIPALIEFVIDELAAGISGVAFTYHVAMAKRIYEALGKAILAPDVATRMRKMRVKLWLAYGTIPAHARAKRDERGRIVEGGGRYEMAEAYREHVASGGVGFMCSSHDGLTEGISLFGGRSVHHHGLHHNASALDQAEKRVNGQGAPPITCYYWLLRRSIDERVRDQVLDKYLMQANMAANSRGAEVRTAFGPKPKETSRAIWDRHVAHLTGRGPLDPPPDPWA